MSFLSACLVHHYITIHEEETVEVHGTAPDGLI
jgi:hypothetical protein